MLDSFEGCDDIHKAVGNWHMASRCTDETSSFDRMFLVGILDGLFVDLDANHRTRVAFFPENSSAVSRAAGTIEHPLLVNPLRGKAIAIEVKLASLFIEELDASVHAFVPVLLQPLGGLARQANSRSRLSTRIPAAILARHFGRKSTEAPFEQN